MNKPFSTTTMQNREFKTKSTQKPGVIVKRFELKDLHPECENSWCVAQWPELRSLLKEIGIEKESNLPWVKLQLILEIDKPIFLEMTYLNQGQNSSGENI